MTTTDELPPLPSVPDEALVNIHEYGDSRADDDGLSDLRISLAILALRQWGGDLQTAARAPLLSELAALRKDNENLRTVMIAAAEEISSRWDAHCDADGYGPANLMHRLEQGIPSQYGYTAGNFAALRERAESAEQALAWQPMHKGPPEPDTECAVMLRYSFNGPMFASIDRWQMLREDPTGMGGPTMEMGYCWADNDENDVVAWIPLPKHPPEEWDQRLAAIKGSAA